MASSSSPAAIGNDGNKVGSSDISARAGSSSLMEAKKTVAPVATPALFPTGKAGRLELKKLLVESTDPAHTIGTFQHTHGLHSMMARSFGTTALQPGERSRRREKSTTRAAAHQKEETVEPFQPESVLEFLTHFKVPRHEVHKRIGDSLRSALEDEIARTPMERKDALLKLLKNAWPFVAAGSSQVRPVLVALIKKLADGTPRAVLERLAERMPDGEARHSELLIQLGLPLRRLVWEADWQKRVTTDTTPTAELLVRNNNQSLVCDMIFSALEEYCGDATLKTAADLAFVGGIRERRMATQVRRANPASSLASTTTGPIATSSSSTNNIAVESSGSALAQIREVMGNRPKLLGAVLTILVAQHGQQQQQKHYNKEEGVVLGGSAYLTCCLVSDVLLTYGQLPKSYEHVGILARILDSCVRLGNISNEALAQVQGCLRVIFQNASQPTTIDTSASNDPIKSEIVSTPSNDALLPPSKKIKREDIDDNAEHKGSGKKSNRVEVDAKAERTFQLKLLRKILTATVKAMKESDPQGLFLNPVSDAIAPGYSSVISEPMCIRVIGEKVAEMEYGGMIEYERDVDLMFQNCITYNIGKEGQWFRGEARRQNKLWRQEILKQAKGLWTSEMAKRKRALDRAEKANRDDKTIKKSLPVERITAHSIVAQNTPTKKVVPVRQVGDRGPDRAKDNAISRLTSFDIDPLPPFKSKKRKKSEPVQDQPNMVALACMILSDPFVVRLLLDKVLLSLRSEVMGGKSVPVAHRAIPSMLQLLSMLQFSSSWCATGGKKFAIPDVGFKEEDPSSYASLRHFTPLLTRLLLETALDKRMAPGGDLHEAAVQALISQPPTEWNIDISTYHSGTSFVAMKSLVEGALVQLMQPGNSNEMALLVQFPRFVVALDKLSSGGSSMLSERPFYMSLIQALLRHKNKLAHSTRDLVVNTWLTKWIQPPTSATTGTFSTISSPAHECFVFLLNEWASLGNLILPRDKLLSLAEAVVQAVDPSDKHIKFAVLWEKEEAVSSFSGIKHQYLRMLKTIDEAHANQWKENMGIDATSLETLTNELRLELEQDETDQIKKEEDNMKRKEEMEEQDRIAKPKNKKRKELQQEENEDISDGQPRPKKSKKIKISGISSIQ